MAVAIARYDDGDMTYLNADDGTQLAIEDLGGPGPVVVLTHGWVLGAGSWEQVARRLSTDGYRTISIDRRGCGRSDRPGGGYDIDTLADDLATVLDTLEVEDVTLVAHSVAGAEAVRMLSRTGSDRVGRLVLVAPTTPGAPPEAQPGADAIAAAQAELLIDRPAYIRDGVAGFFGSEDAASPAMVQWAVGLALDSSLTASLEIMRTTLTADVAADVAACPIPTSVIHGEADPTAPIEFTGRPTAELIPDAELHVIPGAAHGLPLTHPDTLAEAIRAFAPAATVEPVGR